MALDMRKAVAGLVATQILDAVGTGVCFPEWATEHLDQLQVSRRTQRVLVPLKVSSSAGLAVGLGIPEIGVVTSACVVAYYAVAVSYHLRADEHPINALPAAMLGATAAVLLARQYLPAMRRGEGRQSRGAQWRHRQTL